MNFDTIALLIFIIIFALFFIWKRNSFKVHSFMKIFYIGMLRTNFGLKFINNFANKHKKLLQKISPFMIFIAFLGMIIVVADLLYELSKLFTVGKAQSVGLVLPIEGKGIFYVPFVYWIISVFVVMIIHEAGHGVAARAWNIKVKKTGIAFLAAIIPILPAAFVEPDEKQLFKAKKKTQLSVFAAGPFANIVFAFVFLLILSVCLTPITNSFHQSQGLEIVEVPEDSPAFLAGLSVGEIITEMNNHQMKTVENFKTFFQNTKIGDTISVKTDKSAYSITLAPNPKTNERWFGVFVNEKLAVINPNFFKSSLIWLHGLFFWLFLLNLGVGLFNLVPIGPIDGGKMFQITLEKLTHHKKAKFVWKAVSMGILVILLANIIPAFM